MKLNYYPETDSLYIDLSEKTSVDSKEISEGWDVGGDRHRQRQQEGPAQRTDSQQTAV
jgi:uncharacterized protein YuzE